MNFPKNKLCEFITWQTCLTADMRVSSPEAGIIRNAIEPSGLLSVSRAPWFDQ
jgi:hypothetical protein